MICFFGLKLNKLPIDWAVDKGDFFPFSGFLTLVLPFFLSSIGSSFETDGATIGSIVSTGTVGANTADFSWTYASEKSAF